LCVFAYIIVRANLYKTRKMLALHASGGERRGWVGACILCYGVCLKDAARRQEQHRENEPGDSISLGCEQENDRTAMTSRFQFGREMGIVVLSFLRGSDNPHPPCNSAQKSGAFSPYDHIGAPVQLTVCREREGWPPEELRNGRGRPVLIHGHTH